MIYNLIKNTVVASDVKYAKTFGARLKGLLGRTCLSSSEALVISQCQSIHMFFMRFSIDVIFIDPDNYVVGLVVGIKPFALSPIFWKASRAIELASGTIHASRTQIGDRLSFA